MGRQMNGLLYFFVTDMRHQFIIFWSILLASITASILIAYLLLSMDSDGLFFGKSAAMYIFCSFLGFLAVKEGIPFAIKMGATRKNLFASFALFFLAIAFLQSIVASTVHSLVAVGNGTVLDNDIQLYSPGPAVNGHVADASDD